MQRAHRNERRPDQLDAPLAVNEVNSRVGLAGRGVESQRCCGRAPRVLGEVLSPNHAVGAVTFAGARKRNIGFYEPVLLGSIHPVCRFRSCMFNSRYGSKSGKHMVIECNTQPNAVQLWRTLSLISCKVTEFLSTSVAKHLYMGSAKVLRWTLFLALTLKLWSRTPHKAD